MTDILDLEGWNVIAKHVDYALEFWKQWKAPLLAMCEAHKPKEMK